jgi:ADP-dependent NAD(P)H-hydrate dehydratase
MTPAELPRLPPRLPESHKGDYGRALLIGGSRGMTGAIALAGMACLRGGAGLVKLAVPDVCLDVAAGFEPSYMTFPLPSDKEGRLKFAAKDALDELLAAATCVACGPGLGRSGETTRFVKWLYRSVAQPLVLDADALNALASLSNGLAKPAGPRILTPHPGEFARLVGKKQLSPDDQAKQAIALAKQHGLVIVLKGHRTLVTDGTREVRNTTGNPGMATGGTGDVLTGLITALVCQGLAPFEAAQLGVHLHGLAGDLAAAELGQPSLIASDLIRFLPQAMQA